MDTTVLIFGFFIALVAACMVGAVYAGWWMRGAGTYVNRRESQKAQLTQLEIDKGKLELENLRQAARQVTLQQQATPGTP